MKTRTWLALLLVGPLLALGLGACSKGSNNASPKASPSLDAKQMQVKFTECMREQGIDVQDSGTLGGGSGSGVITMTAEAQAVPSGQAAPSGAPPGASDFEKAMDKCREFQPNGGKPEKLSPEQLEQQRAMARCMRENGVPDFPDPDPNGGGQAIGVEGGEAGAEAMGKAMQKCANNPSGVGTATN